MRLKENRFRWIVSYTYRCPHTYVKKKTMKRKLSKHSAVTVTWHINQWLHMLGSEHRSMALPAGESEQLVRRLGVTVSASADSSARGWCAWLLTSTPSHRCFCLSLCTENKAQVHVTKKNHFDIIYVYLQRMYLWWSLCTLYLHACQVRVTTGDSGLCCCDCVMSFKR